MATSTTRLTLRKPDPNPVTGDNVDAAADLNANWDKVDAAIGAISCTSGARPATPYVGQMARETDTGNLIVCTSTGPSVWAYIYGDNQTRAAAGTAVYKSKVVADAQDRLSVAADGTLVWGSGAAVGDTNLYRSAVDTLKTDDSFIAVGSISGSNIPYRDRKTVVGASVASITFTSVPSSLRNIKIIWTARGDNATQVQLVWLRINGASGAVYNVAYIQNTNGSLTGTPAAAASQAVVGLATGSTAPAGDFGAGDITIAGWDSPHAGYLGFQFNSSAMGSAVANFISLVGGGNYVTAGPYTSITILPQSGLWVAGSDFTLWGDPT